MYRYCYPPEEIGRLALILYIIVKRSVNRFWPRIVVGKGESIHIVSVSEIHNLIHGGVR